MTYLFKKKKEVMYIWFLKEFEPWVGYLASFINIIAFYMTISPLRGTNSLSRVLFLLVFF